MGMAAKRGCRKLKTKRGVKFKMDNNELMHYGVLGMKWGVRRARRVVSDDYKKTHSKKKIDEMSDAELRARNNRLQMEKQYRDLTKKTNVGKKLITGFIKGAGTITAVMGAYAVYKKVGNQALDAIGDMVVNNIKW